MKPQHRHILGELATYLVAAVAMAVTFVASMLMILMVGWVFIYGDDGPGTAGMIIEAVIAFGISLFAFAVVFKVIKNIRAHLGSKATVAAPSSPQPH